MSDALSFLGDKYHASDTTAAVGTLNAAAECVPTVDVVPGVVPPDPPPPSELCIVVTITYPYEARPLVPGYGPGWTTPDTVTSKAVVTL